MRLPPVDPQYGPLLSAAIWLLLLLIAFLVVTLPFSRAPTAQVSALTALAGLLGVALNLRGRIGDRRRDR